MSDLISRRMMLDKMISRKRLFSTNQYEYMALSEVDKARADEIDNCIADLRNAPDAELEVFEFCASGKNPCKEYDQQNHCCHRWTKVIRQTVEELKAQKPETIAKVKEAWGLAMCESCKKRVYKNDIYCSHCGAKLEWNE